MEALTAFLTNRVYPALFAQLDSAFPEFGFKRRGCSWIATVEAHTRTLSGGPRPDRVEAYENTPYGFAIHGSEFVSWLSYVSGSARPSGRDFTRAVEILCAKAEIPKLSKGRKPNEEWLQRQENALSRNAPAMEWLLQQRRFRPSVVKRFRLGLSLPNPERAYTHALVFPIFDRDFIPLRRYAYYSIPGVTTLREDAEKRSNGWAPGSPTLYYGANSQGRSSVLLVEGMKDLWAVMGLLEDDVRLAQELLVVTRTHGGTCVPEELKAQNWWNQFARIYIGLDPDATGKAAVDKLLPLTAKEVRIARVHERFGKDWNDLTRGGGTVADLKQALEAAKIVAPSAAPKPLLDGDLKRVDVTSAFYNGFQYVTTEQHVRATIDGEECEEMRTVVVRSDGAILGTSQKRTILKEGRPILRLTDSTPILRPPRPQAHRTWRWQSIRAFCDALKSGKRPVHQPIQDLLRRTAKHVAAHVWLPYSEDYTLCALAIAASYAQEVFEAVPLLLVIGERNTGKSELSKTCATIACNGVFLSRATPAALVDNADQSPGWQSIDDFEALGTRGRENEASSFGDFQQLIKMSYKKATAIYRKMTTVGTKLEQVQLRFYGIKMINNTQGVDEIVASRMFRIPTRAIPPELKDALKAKRSDILTPEQIHSLRDDFHTWSMTETQRIVA